MLEGDSVEGDIDYIMLKREGLMDCVKLQWWWMRVWMTG